MDYNGLCKSILLLKLENGEYVPLASVMPSYGPFISLDAALADLGNTFKSVSRVPKGYTFCLIEDNTLQEYWFTKDGDVGSIQKKNTGSSSSTTVVSGVQMRAHDGYIQVSYDGGETWNNLVPLEDLRGPQGYTGATGAAGPTGNPGKDADLSKIKLRITTTTDEDEDHNIIYRNVLEISYTGGDPYYPVGTIIGGSGSGSGSGGVIGIGTDPNDGNKYWTIDGNWMYDDQGHRVRANGIDGQNGQDGRDGAGAFISFKSIVFKRTNVDISSQRPTGGTYNHPIPDNPSGWFDGVPSGSEEKLWMSTKWFYSIESMNDDNSNPWSLPGPATDTADIDFEYSNAPIDIDRSILRNPSTNRYSAGNPTGWYDPTEHDELLEDANWMAMRKKKNGEWETQPADTNGWIILKIRGENGTSGVSPTAHFKSIAFRRSDNYTIVNNKAVLNQSEYPSGGDYSNPNPTNTDGHGNLLWTDGIPQNNKEKLWETTCIFHSDGTNEGWTTPQVVADSEYMDYEYAEENPAYPKPQRRSPDDANPDYPSGRENDGWDDEPDYTKDYVWRAERPIVGNKYAPGSDWLVIRIKGEKGTDGTSVTIKGTLSDIFSTWDQAWDARSRMSDGALIYVETDDPTTGTNEIGIYRYNSSGNTYTKLNPTVGDGYIYEGDLYVWDGDSLVNVGPIQGPPGPAGTSYYLHIKYSNDNGLTFTPNHGEDPGKYIGTYTNTFESKYAEDTMDITKYKWQEWVGQDGFGYEYIFYLTEDYRAPDVPTLKQCVPYQKDGQTINYQNDDYVPEFLDWTDDPQEPYKDKPYCWVAYRKKVDGVWREYRGSSTNRTKGALFSMYSSKGRGLSEIVEMYAVGTSGTVPPASSAFDQTIPSFDPEHGLIYLWNYEVVTYDDGSAPVNTDPVCIGAYIQGKGIGKVVEYYYASQYGPRDDGEPENSNAYPPAIALPGSSWSKQPLRVTKEKPYLWNYEVVWYDDETICNVTKPACIAYYVYTDVEYLLTIFKKVEGDADTAYLGGLIGAIDEDDKVRAMLNATDIGKDDEHGKLYIAAGMDGLEGTDTQKNSSAQNATFKVYEDGHVAMRSAELQGYLTQHFRRVHDVSQYIVDVGNGTQTRYLDRSKLSNAVLLGWNTLSFTEGGQTVNFGSNYQVNLGTIMQSDNAGRVIFSNQLYMSKNGTVYSNNNYGKTLLTGYFVLPDGAITNGSSGVALYGGWIEVIKISTLDTDMQLIDPQPSSMNNIYIVTGWGGSVRFTFAETLPNINANQAVTSFGNPAVGFNGDTTRNASIAISDSDTVYRVTEFNRNLFVGGSSSSDTLYIIVPNMFYVDTWYDYTQKPVQINIFLKENHRRVVFKVEPWGANTPDEDVENLVDLQTMTGDALVIGRSIAGGGTAFSEGTRISYIPASGYNIGGSWLAERITSI